MRKRTAALLTVFGLGCGAQPGALDPAPAFVEVQSASGWDAFRDVPPEVVAAARAAWGSDRPPAMTLAFGFSPGSLEDTWAFSLSGVSDRTGAACDVGPGSRYRQRDQLVTQGGFVFLTRRDLCGAGSYTIDNRQGGWFDYVCGPLGRTLRYDGAPVFSFVHLWCE